MSAIAWNQAGERLFETGVDRGVLYIDDDPGVPWNGLVSVSESPVGGEVTPHYYDGIKYLDHVSLEEFQATIEAYTYPEEFAQCDGTADMGNGLSATHQTRKPFNLSYRTMVGNDLEGVDHGYKIHLVYGVTAAPSQKQNNTMSSEVDPSNFSWTLHTKAPDVVGYTPTAHFIIDSRKVPPSLLSVMEDILYGTDNADSRLPPADELVFIFDNYDSTIYDAGTLNETYYETIDAGELTETHTETIDAGGP